MSKAITALVVLILLALIVLQFFLPRPEHVLPTLALDEWFAARWRWAIVLGLAFGVTVAAFLSATIKHAPSVDIDRNARLSFLAWSLGSVFVAGVLIVIDAMKVYPFS